jgi:hypothetical protein
MLRGHGKSVCDIAGRHRSLSWACTTGCHATQQSTLWQAGLHAEDALHLLVGLCNGEGSNVHSTRTCMFGGLARSHLCMLATCSMRGQQEAFQLHWAPSQVREDKL